jgi:hypothetical protein
VIGSAITADSDYIKTGIGLKFEYEIWKWKNGGVSGNENSYGS